MDDESFYGVFGDTLAFACYTQPNSSRYIKLNTFLVKCLSIINDFGA